MIYSVNWKFNMLRLCCSTFKPGRKLVSCETAWLLCFNFLIELLIKLFFSQEAMNRLLFGGFFSKLFWHYFIYFFRVQSNTVIVKRPCVKHPVSFIQCSLRNQLMWHAPDYELVKNIPNLRMTVKISVKWCHWILSHAEYMEYIKLKATQTGLRLIHISSLW